MYIYTHIHLDIYWFVCLATYTATLHYTPTHHSTPSKQLKTPLSAPHTTLLCLSILKPETLNTETL